MATILNVFQQLGELLQKYPELAEIEFCACGTDSRLNIFRSHPNGPVTGLSLEDASHMEGHISYAQEMVQKVNVELSEEHMEYLIQMCLEEASDAQIEAFLNEYGIILEEPEKEAPMLIYEVMSAGVGVFYQEGKFLVGNPEEILEPGVAISEGLPLARVQFTKVWQLRDFLREEFGISVTSTDIMASYFEAKFGVNQDLTRYYMDQYNAMVDNVIKAEDILYDRDGIPKELRDYGEAIANAEKYAMHDEAVGSFLCYYMDDPLAGWYENTKDKTLYNHEKHVGKSLQRLFGKQREKKVSLDGKIQQAREHTSKNKTGATVKEYTR